MYAYRTRRRIEFSDTDMAGIVHFSRFPVFMESAEHAFLRSLGTSVHTSVNGQTIGWPRLRISCEFLRPLRFEDEVEIVLTIRRRGTKSMTYAFEFVHEGERVARGELVTACCVVEPGRPPRAIPIPRAIAERLDAVAAGKEEAKRA